MGAPPSLPPPTVPAAAAGARGDLRAHLRDPMYRTGYLLIVGAGIGSLLGFVFWVLAARAYSAHVVGLSSATISAMMLVSGACTLGLNAVLVRYLPAAGRSTRALVVRTYGVTLALSVVVGAAAALTSGLWSPELRFLADDPVWLVGFTAATAAWTVFSLQDSVLTGLHAAHWVPVENSLYSAAKLVLLLAVPSVLPIAGPFVAWNAPLALPIAVISVFVFRRLIPRHGARGASRSLDRRQVIRVAAGNYGGTLFSLAATLFLPILVANATSSTTTAYFYIPWTIATGLQLVALNMTTSFTVEAALASARLWALYRRALVQTLRILLPMAVVLAVGAPYILRAFGQAYADEGATLLRLLVAGTIPNVVVVLGLGAARVAHRGRDVLGIQAAQCVLVLGLSVALLPSMGIDGVGVAWLVSQTAVAAWLGVGALRSLLRRREAAT